MPKTKHFSEQVALVTGVGTGIGRALAEALATAGARVVIASRREEILRRTAEELNQKCDFERVFVHPLDLRDRGQIDSLVTDVIDRWRSLDVIVNNSGLAVPETVDQITEDGWDKVLETNLRGITQLVRAALPHMIDNDFGDIVNISSQGQAWLRGRAFVLRFKVWTAGLRRKLA